MYKFFFVPTEIFNKLYPVRLRSKLQKNKNTRLLFTPKSPTILIPGWIFFVVFYDHYFFWFWTLIIRVLSSYPPIPPPSPTTFNQSLSPPFHLPLLGEMKSSEGQNSIPSPPFFTGNKVQQSFVFVFYQINPN